MLFYNQYKSYVLIAFLTVSFGVFSGTVNLNINGLEDLGPNARYEGWLLVDGNPVSTGTFSVNELGNLNQTEFIVSEINANSASAFIISIEPFPDQNPQPSDSKLLAGDINEGLAELNVGHIAAIGDNFTESIGKFELINPTGTKGSSFVNGIWYVDSFPPPTTANLNLPTLPTGWTYEGWVIDNNANLPISTGTFTDENAPDSDGAGPDAGPSSGFLFPGQDYINPARDLSINHTAVISVEPVPDNSPSPFTLKPLALQIAGDFGTQTMNNNAILTNPFGQVRVIAAGEPAIVQTVPTLEWWSILLIGFLFILIVYLRFNKILL